MFDNMLCTHGSAISHGYVNLFYLARKLPDSLGNEPRTQIWRHRLRDFARQRHHTQAASGGHDQRICNLHLPWDSGLLLMIDHISSVVNFAALKDDTVSESGA